MARAIRFKNISQKMIHAPSKYQRVVLGKSQYILQWFLGMLIKLQKASRIFWSTGHDKVFERRTLEEIKNNHDIIWRITLGLEKIVQIGCSRS